MQGVTVCSAIVIVTFLVYLGSSILLERMIYTKGVGAMDNKKFEMQKGRVKFTHALSQELTVALLSAKAL